MLRIIHVLAQETVKPAEAPTKIVAQPAGIHSVQDVLDRVVEWALLTGPKVLLALGMFIAAWIIAGWLRRIVVAGFVKAHVELTLAKFFGNISKWTIIAFAVITCMGTLGINTASAAAIVGASGLAIGLALQGNLGNLASGILLLIFRPFKVGDSVVVAGQAGVVDGIDLFTTYLDTGDNRRIIVPNGAVFGGVIENQTRHMTRRVIVTVPVSGAADMDKTRAALREAVEKTSRETTGSIPQPPPSVTLSELFPTVTWTVALTAETSRTGAVREALLREVKLAVDKSAIGPTPPVTNVSIQSMPKA